VRNHDGERKGKRMFGFGEGNGEGNGGGNGGDQTLFSILGVVPMMDLLVKDGALPVLKATDPKNGFPDQWWSPMLRAQLVQAEFAKQSDWNNKQDLPPPPSDPAVLRAEIEGLLAKASARMVRLTEITAQSDSFVDYWCRLLMCDNNRRPLTVTLIQIGVAVGGMVALYWKDKYKRLRPAQAFPALTPAISTPPHPSYPSGHSTQAHLIWLCLRGVVPDALDTLTAHLAARIAQNREIAGVHYSSDTRAGRLLASATFERLCKINAFIDIQERARTFEWASVQSTSTSAEIPVPTTIVDDFADTVLREMDARNNGSLS
jgi:membrane-associated phospholipid phosphatase